MVVYIVNKELGGTDGEEPGKRELVRVEKWWVSVQNKGIKLRQGGKNEEDFVRELEPAKVDINNVMKDARTIQENNKVDRNRAIIAKGQIRKLS